MLIKAMGSLSYSKGKVNIKHTKVAIIKKVNMIE